MLKHANRPQVNSQQKWGGDLYDNLIRTRTFTLIMHTILMSSKNHEKLATALICITNYLVRTMCFKSMRSELVGENKPF